MAHEIWHINFRNKLLYIHACVDACTHLLSVILSNELQGPSYGDPYLDLNQDSMF